MKSILTFLLIVSTGLLFGQSNPQKAKELGQRAITLMDNGLLLESIELLKEAQKLDPKDATYPYEIALAHYILKDYKTSISVLKKLTKHPDVFDRVYQLMGNAYDLDGNPAKAIATYEKGLKLFPKSGILHLERGNMEYFDKNYNGAMEYYEKGIEAEPRFPSNYFRAASLYFTSTEVVWGMIYGEIFMNLERNSKRTEIMSELLYKAYLSQITFPTDSTVSVAFSKTNVITLESLKNPAGFKLPYPMLVYVPVTSLAAALERKVDHESLSRIRTNFLNIYEQKGFQEEYPNALFEYQKRILDAGHFESYNYWLLMKGDQQAFDVWHEANEEKYKAFVEWFLVNPLEVDEQFRFYRRQY